MRLKHILVLFTLTRRSIPQTEQNQANKNQKVFGKQGQLRPIVVTKLCEIRSETYRKLD